MRYVLRALPPLFSTGRQESVIVWRGILRIRKREDWTCLPRTQCNRSPQASSQYLKRILCHF
jgi:hypothetical protein